MTYKGSNLIIAVVLIVFFFNSQLFSQSKNNLKSLDRIKTKQSKAEINELINGCWIVVKRVDKKNELMNLFGYEVNYCFRKDSLVYIGNDIVNNKVSGKFYYDSVNKEVHIEYINPIIPGKGSIPDALLDSLVKKEAIKPIKYTILEINKLDEKELVLIEHLPHDEKHLDYHLIYYKRE